MSSSITLKTWELQCQLILVGSYDKNKTIKLLLLDIIYTHSTIVDVVVVVVHWIQMHGEWSGITS